MKNKQATNQSEMRNSNEMLILNIIRKMPCSRAQIAKHTGLSRAGVTIIMDKLVERGIVEEIAESNNSIGRKALCIRIRPDAAYVIGVHLRSQMYSVGVFDFSGGLISMEDIDYCSNFVPAAQLIDVSKHVLRLIENSNVDKSKVLAIGICTSGPVDVKNGKIIRPSSKWHEIEIVKILESLLPWKCFLENRSNARALYEKLYGVCREYENFIFFKVDESVGGSIVYKNEILNGYNRFGNEFGHMSIKYDGEPCECGNHGCLDKYASIPAILKKYAQMGLDSWSLLTDAAYNGDPDAIQAVREEAAYLSAGIVTLCNIFAPDAVALTGDIAYRPSLLLALISENVNTSHILRGTYNPAILVAEQTSSSYLMASAAIVIEEFYQGKINFF